MGKLTKLMIISFVASHAGAEHFEADVKLYGKVLPNSSLLPELKDPPKYRIGQLHERVLLELLEEVEPDAVFENRGVKTVKDDTRADEEKAAKAFEKAKGFVSENEVKDIPYNEQKKLVKDLNLTVADNKGATIAAALELFKDKLLLADAVGKLKASSKPGEGNPDADPDGAGKGEPKPGTEPEKPEGSDAEKPDNGLSVTDVVIDEAKNLKMDDNAKPEGDNPEAGKDPEDLKKKEGQE